MRAILAQRWGALVLFGVAAVIPIFVRDLSLIHI